MERRKGARQAVPDVNGARLPLRAGGKETRACPDEKLVWACGIVPGSAYGFDRLARSKNGGMDAAHALFPFVVGEQVQQQVVIETETAQ